jgi:hypothetical protein
MGCGSSTPSNHAEPSQTIPPAPPKQEERHIDPNERKDGPELQTDREALIDFAPGSAYSATKLQSQKAIAKIVDEPLVPSTPNQDAKMGSTRNLKENSNLPAGLANLNNSIPSGMR